MSTAPARPSAYGPIVSASHVERAVLTMLSTWLHSYLTELERRDPELKINDLPRPRTYRVTTEWERMPEDQLPAVLLYSPGTLEPLPTADGEGYYRACWDLRIGCLVSARSLPGGYTAALGYARMWAAAVRVLMLQQRDTVDDANRLLGMIDWLGETYDTVAADSDRTICQGNVACRVWCDEVAQRFAGPIEPIIGPEPPVPPEESPYWPVAETSDVELIKVPVEEEIADG